jgi:signal transduction histidine kinase
LQRCNDLRTKATVRYIRTFSFYCSAAWLSLMTPPLYGAPLGASVADGRGWIVGAVVALCLAIAGGAFLLAQRERRHTVRLRHWAARIFHLLESTPQAYVLVNTDGQLQTSDKLRGWLGLPRKLAALADLEPGLLPDDYLGLMADVALLQNTGTAFDRAVKTTNERILLVQGRAGGTKDQINQCILWLSDVREPLKLRATHSNEQSEVLADLNAATAILEAAPFPIWHRDAQLNLRHVNSAYVKAVGGRDAVETISSKRDISPPTLAQTALASGTAQHSPASMIVDGVRRSLQVFEVPLGPDGVGGFALDITDREEQANTLVRFAEAQRDTLDMLSAPVAIFGADQKLMFHNVAFSRLFRLEPEWLAEKPRHGDILERLRETRLVPEQSDFAKWKQSLLAQYTNLLKAEEDLWHLPNETTLRVVTQPHPQGGLQLLFEDVTPRLVLERSYNTLFKVQQVTLDNLYEGTAVFRADGTLSLTNAALERLWQCAPGSFDSGVRVTKWLDIIKPRLADADDAAILEQAILTVIVERRSSTGTLLCLDDISLTYIGVPLPDGSALITFLDVSDGIRIQRALQDRNEALEAGDKLKTAFLENMSYQLRTPLQNILGFSEMLDQGYLGKLEPKQEIYLKDILGETKKLDGLIQDVLELTVSDVGTVLLDVTDVDIKNVLEELIGETRARALRKKLVISFEHDNAVGIVRGDARRLKLALDKILANALEFTPNGGSIALVASGTLEGVCVIIRDSGSGISDLDKSTIFESFRKGENAKGTKGLGLGLALSRHLLSLHGGSIELDSKLGTGTTVTITMPRRPPVSPANG